MDYFCRETAACEAAQSLLHTGIAYIALSSKAAQAVEAATVATGKLFLPLNDELCEAARLLSANSSSSFLGLTQRTVEGLHLQQFQCRIPHMPGCHVPWPIYPMDFESASLTAFQVLHGISVAILKEMISCVGGDEKKFVKELEDRDKCFDAHDMEYSASSFFLRCIVPLEGECVEKQHERVRAHTDTGVMTILPHLSPDSLKGLQILSNEGHWENVNLNHETPSVMCFAGEGIIELMSNLGLTKFPSPLVHRVVQSAADIRITLPFQLRMQDRDAGPLQMKSISFL